MENPDYHLKSGLQEMDFVKVTEMLASAFWCKGIQIDEVKKGALHSALVVGAFLRSGVQIGFARVISDQTRFAYILDVIVDEAYQRLGVGQAMLKYILAHPELKDVYQWFLVSSTARGVYRKVGFKELSNPEKMDGAKILTGLRDDNLSYPLDPDKNKFTAGT